MRCPSCGHDNPDDATFCGECGSSLQSELTCSTCGRSNPPTTRFCYGCGQSLSQPAAPARPPMSAPSPAVPTSFASGRYQVQRVLGEGAKKRVYLAHDTRLDRDVAFALIKTEGLDAEGLTRVRREAQAMGRLSDHPHIVTIFDIGEESGQPYIVSQYMAGGDIEGLLRETENHRLPIEQAIRVADQICQALEHAHERRVVHRDLKPSNVWLSQDGTAKLGDFGLAIALDRSRLTRAGTMVGTVAYMPPEQVLGREPDARSDLYSLGATLYEMVTGRPPFLGDDLVSIISQHINTPPVAPSWHNPEVSRALEALILRLLAKAPEERPETAAAVRQALSVISSAPATAAERVLQEEANPLDRLAAGVFVGRERDMDELRAALEDALSGRGRLLLLVGEPGIGKTRTAEELATYAQLRSAQVLWGRCYEGEGAPAYWPWVQIIRSYAHDRDPEALVSDMGPGAADIAQVVPEVRERLPGVPTPAPLEPEQARFRLFDSITTFLKNAAKDQPIVLVLDDLQWADKPSLLLLRFLARELRATRLLVLGAYRDVELGHRHPLAETLGELVREQISQRILLRGLTEPDVARFIEMTAGLKPPEALVAAVYRETEGNPLFVNEIVRLLVTDGRLQHPEEVTSWSFTIPQGVREVVGQRLDRLSEECERVLTIASVVGREFGMDALGPVTNLADERLLELMEEAVASRVITEVPGAVGRYSFSHALVRETLYDELSATRRVRLHRQIGEVLESLYGANLEQHLAELAYHFFEAVPGGEPDKAIEYATRAAEGATALLAYEEAATQYQRALQALELKEAYEPQRCELLLALGEAQMKAGDVPKGKETLHAAAEVARGVRAPEQLARAALGFGGAGGVTGVVDESLVNLLQEALGALGARDTALRARVLGRLAQALHYSASPAQRESLSREAVEVARRVGDKPALAYALITRQSALWGPGNLEDRLSAATEVLALAEEADDRETALWARQSRLADLLEKGDMAAVDAEIKAGARLAGELRQPWYLWWIGWWRAMRALLEGRFEEAERLARQALAIGQRVQEQNALQIFAVQLFLLRREQGRLKELEAVVKAFVEQGPAVPAWRCALAYAHSELSWEQEARSEFERLAVNNFGDLPKDGLWLIALALLSEVCAVLRDVRRAQTLFDLLLPYAGRNIVVGNSVGCAGSASHYLGHLAATMSRWEDAEAHFEAALQFNARMGARPWLAHTQHEYAEMLLARGRPGDREKALELLDRASDTAQELGMKSLIEKVLALKLKVQGILTSVGLRTSIDTVASVVEAERPDFRPQAAPDGTVTIMFSDIEGFTALAERLGDRRALDVLHAHNAIVREHVSAHGGFEVKSQGDGFMIAFQSARRALQCAVDIQRALAAYDVEHQEEPIRVRMGLHTGEVIREADDFFGRDVILAARIADQARGGEILVSSLLKELTENAAEIQFEEGREVELKGLSGTHAVHRVAWP